MSQNRIALLLTLTIASSGCATAKTNPRRAVRIAKRALVGIDVALERLQPIVDEATAARIAKCEPTPPGPERDACLGVFAKEVAPTVQRAGEIYDGLVELLDELAETWVALEQLREAARQEVR